MLEPPSATLVTLLRNLRLCTPADLRRCRGRVRRLASDLPAFDSVWIDALVQLRRLTPYQAQILESSHPEQLRVGPCVIVERLGSGFGGTSYIARALKSRQLRYLRVVELDEEHQQSVMDRASVLTSAGAALVHPSVVMPQTCEVLDGRAIFVARHIPGRTLTELLVRRGRFPAAVVAQIGRQLADGLARLHASGIAHGDIRPSQVRLLSEGTAVLLDAGIQGVLEPELTPHSQLVPECYDCVAPELIGTGQTYNAQSDLYALGCLLWQLLAGRPPFPGGDPLGKLAAHQTRRIRDVRDFAPDTPPKLAEMIWQLTSPNVNQRPENATRVIQVWGPPRRSGRQLLKKFVRSFERPVSPGFKLTTLSSSPLMWTLALLFAVSGLTAYTFHEGTRTTLLRVWAALPERPRLIQRVADASTPGSTAQEIQTGSSAAEVPTVPLPEPDAHGVVELHSAGPFAASKIVHLGALTIRGKTGLRPEIVVEGQTWSLVAEKITLQNLRVRRAAETPEVLDETQSLTSLVQVSALELELRDCTFLTHSTSVHAPVRTADTQERSDTPAAIAWQLSEISGTDVGQAKLENIVALGRSPLLQLAGPARRITARNVLRLGAGSLLRLDASSQRTTDLVVQLDHVTCRQSGSLLSWKTGSVNPDQHQVRISASHCVFDMLPEVGGLIEFEGSEKLPAWLQRVQFIGNGCLASESSEIAVQYLAAERTISPLDNSDMELEGITQGGFRFSGPFGLRAANSTIDKDYAGVKNSAALPGILLRPQSTAAVQSGSDQNLRTHQLSAVTPARTPSARSRSARLDGPVP